MCKITRWEPCPEGFGAGDSNLYRYVNNGPTNATDPTGQVLYAANSSIAQQTATWLAGGKSNLNHFVGDGPGLRDVSIRGVSGGHYEINVRPTRENYESLAKWIAQRVPAGLPKEGTFEDALIRMFSERNHAELADLRRAPVANRTWTGAPYPLIDLSPKAPVAPAAPTLGPTSEEIGAKWAAAAEAKAQAERDRVAEIDARYRRESAYSDPKNSGIQKELSRLGQTLVMLVVNLTPGVAALHSAYEQFEKNGNWAAGTFFLLLAAAEVLPVAGKLTSAVVRQRVLAHIAESQAASRASNFHIHAGFERLAQLRRELGLPNTGDRAADGVLTMFQLNGRQTFGINSWAGVPSAGDVSARALFTQAGFRNPATGNVPIRAVANHAEGDALFQAFRQGNTGGNGQLFVDSTLCGFCGRNGGVRGMGNGLNLQNLEVFELLPTGQVRRTANILSK